jgi:hypothetical protein
MNQPGSLTDLSSTSHVAPQAFPRYLPLPARCRVGPPCRRRALDQPDYARVDARRSVGAHLVVQMRVVRLGVVRQEGAGREGGLQQGDVGGLGDGVLVAWSVGVGVGWGWGRVAGRAGMHDLVIVAHRQAGRAPVYSASGVVMAVRL